MWIQWPFLQKKLEPKVIDPRWPLTPNLLRSHVWLYPRIIVSKSHENTSKYVDTVNLFAKTWSKGHWPLDDLWPHICWGHMCDSTQGSLCPSPMGIHQCMRIQWSILQKITTYIHILHTHTYYVQNQWSHSLFLNYVQARQKIGFAPPVKASRLFPAVAKWLDWFSVVRLYFRLVWPFGDCLKSVFKKWSKNVTESVTSPRFQLACYPSCQVVMSHLPHAVLYRDNNQLLRD